MWFQNRRAKWRKKENTKKGPGRPAHNALPLTCSGDPIPEEELRRKEEQRLAKKRRRELERLERAAARKMAGKPSRNTTLQACGPEETVEVDVIGVAPPTVHDNTSVASDLAIAEANSTDLDISGSDREQSDVIKQDMNGEDHRLAIDPMGDRTDTVSRKSPLQLIIGTDATSSVSRPAEMRACPFSIESLLEQHRPDPPSEHPTNEARRSNNRTCKRLVHLQFQPIGFQVERLSPSAIPQSTCIHNTSPAD